MDRLPAATAHYIASPPRRVVCQTPMGTAIATSHLTRGQLWHGWRMNSGYAVDSWGLGKLLRAVAFSLCGSSRGFIAN